MNRVVFILLLTSSNILAQKIINLSEIKMQDSPSFPFYIEKVINATGREKIFGYIGAGERRVPLLFEQPLDVEFQTLFNSSHQRASKSSLIIRINHFFYHVMYYGTLFPRVAEINMSFISVDTNGTYWEYPSIGMAMIADPPIGMASALIQSIKNPQFNTIEKTIVFALEYCFSLFLNRLKYFPNPNIITEQNLSVNPLQSDSTYKIHTINKYDRCIFTNFIDFRDYTPCTECEFTVEYHHAPFDDAIPLYDEDNAKYKHVWGFSDGERIFARFGSTFYPLLKDGDFTLKGQIPFWQDGKGEKVNLKVNFITGNLDPIDDLGIKKAYGEMVFYFSGYNPEGSELSIIIDGINQCTLPKGTFYPHYTSPEIRQIEVCLKNISGSVCQTIPNPVFNRKLFLCDLKKGIPAFDKLSSELESDIKREIDNGKIQKSCTEDK